MKGNALVPSWWDDQAAGYVKRVRFSLNHWSHGYYVLNETPVPDLVWQRYYEDLQWLADQFPGTLAPYCPTQNVGCACPECKPDLYTLEDLQAYKKTVKSNLVSPD